MQIDEVIDVGASSQKQEEAAAAAAAAAADDDDDNPNAPPINVFGKHAFKVYLTDGERQVVGLDVSGVLTAAYQQSANRGRGATNANSFISFFAGAKVQVGWRSSLQRSFSHNRHSLIIILFFRLP